MGEDDAHGIGEVVIPDIAEDGDIYRPLRPAVNPFLRKPPGLAAEDEDIFYWSCPYQTGHASNLFESLRNSRGDLIFSAL